ncbi:MAG: MBL fold metallo-hydrolase [Bacilli bacterium]|nr:MBL fold metallo-hydrolase [Bacilli bacterium]
MDVTRVVTGLLDENCYILKKNNKVIIVDPGDDYNKIKAVIGDDKVLGILITHSHFDHVGALRNFLVKKSIRIFKKSNLEDNKSYELGDFKFKCLFTPGHSSDSVSFYFPDDKVMFVGDFIFKGSIGRCDLPTGSTIDMNNSIARIMQYDDDITLYTGHYDITNLGDEKKNNPYLK